MLAEELPAILKNLLTTVDNAINQVSNGNTNGVVNGFDGDVSASTETVIDANGTNGGVTDSKATARGHTIKRRQVLKKKDALKWNNWDQTQQVHAKNDDSVNNGDGSDEPDSPLDAASMPLSCFGDSIPHIDSDEDSSDELRKIDSCKLCCNLKKTPIYYSVNS